MKSLIAKYILFFGVFALFLLAIIIASQSIFPLEGQELYCLLGFVFFMFFILPVSISFKLISVFNKEKSMKLITVRNKNYFIVAGLFLMILSLPAIKNQYYIAKYGLSYSWQWSGGSENFITIKVKGKEACTVWSKVKLTFGDANADGYKDIFYGEGKAMIYEPKNNTLIECPVLGG